MRKSDENKDPFSDSHDQQIGGIYHDKIVMWLYEILAWDFDTVSGIVNIPPKKIVSVQREIETPLFSQNNWRTAGFADLKITASEKYFYTEEDFRRNDSEIAEVMRKEKFCLERQVGFVEVKTSVNIGETIRQLNYYKSNGGNGRWTVCAPPTPYSKVLIEHGFHFIEYVP